MSLNLSKIGNDSPLQCLIVDDEPLAREGIIDFCAQLDFLQVAGACGTALEAADYIQKGNIDLMFLDINMPYLSGLGFLESMEHAPLTILTTAYSEHALEGYRLQIVDYLLKPIAFKRFYQAALKARQLHLATASVKLPQPVDTFLYIRQGDGFKKISWVDILFIEGMQNYAKLYFKDRELVIHQTMISLEASLPADNFFRIHKSYLINIAHIDSVSGGRVFINGNELPISRNRREELLKEVVYTKLLSR